MRTPSTSGLFGDRTRDLFYSEEPLCVFRGRFFYFLRAKAVDFGYFVGDVADENGFVRLPSV